MPRTQAGRLHLVDGVGKISLADVSLIEDPSEDERNDDGIYGKRLAAFQKIVSRMKGSKRKLVSGQISE